MMFCVGGGALLDVKQQEFFAAFGVPVYQGYGLTETSAAITIEPVGNPSKDGSVGLPLPDVIIKVVDIETGKWDQPVGQTGEIAVRCPQVMAGFWNSLEETAEMLRGGWLYTGDIGHMDEEGYLFVTSRKQQLIKVSGFQVWPQEVVAVLKKHFMV